MAFLAVDDVPTGVDTAFFRPHGAERREPHNLVFTGSMDWLPNEDAIRYFTEQIMPLVKQEIEDVTLTVVGAQSVSGADRPEQAARPFDYGYRASGRCATLHGTRCRLYCAAANRGRYAAQRFMKPWPWKSQIVSTTVGAGGLAGA